MPFDEKLAGRMRRIAMAFHASRGESLALPINFILGGLAAFVVWGRLKKAPIAPKP